MAFRRSKNWKIVKPNPIADIAVRAHAICVRSKARRVRNQAKCVPASARTFEPGRRLPGARSDHPGSVSPLLIS
jgi:hypothetical protein